MGVINYVRLANHFSSTNHRIYHLGNGVYQVRVTWMDSVPTNYGSFMDYRPYLAMFPKTKY